MIVFDFDGVLIDSVDEVIVTAYNAAFHAAAVKLADVDPRFSSFMKINRPRPRSAGEIAILADWVRGRIESLPPGLISKSEFEHIAAASKHDPRDMEERFFRARSAFIEAHKQEWLELNKPYRPLWDALCRLGRVSIVTYKNTSAVLELCRHYGLPVQAEDVYSTSGGGGSKAEHLRTISYRFENSALYYLDDSLRNLAEVQDSAGGDVSLLWATWGYTAPEDVETAAEMGFTAVTQDDVIKMLKLVKGARS